MNWFIKYYLLSFANRAANVGDGLLLVASIGGNGLQLAVVSELTRLRNSSGGSVICAFEKLSGKVTN